MSHISEVDSEDSFDADDVELLLAPVTHLAAPTPAMPRLRTRRQRGDPETPREATLTTYRQGRTSPSNSFLPDVPESPCLSSINSPSGYGSISQVLLPDVTPSPAVHHYSPPARDRDLDGAADASLVTLLRLQLAAAENTAKERLYQMQVMEKEIHTIKNTRRQDEENLTQQLDCLETNMREQLEARERTECERQVYIASLELRLQQAGAAQSEAVDDAVAKAAEALKRSHARALQVESCKWTAACSAREASSKWFFIRMRLISFSKM
ncbi:glycosyltransferase family protein [Salix suchowensis]|nr:glycosyltransferase family protein [Salix suchowensis]